MADELTTAQEVAYALLEIDLEFRYNAFPRGGGEIEILYATAKAAKADSRAIKPFKKYRTGLDLRTWIVYFERACNLKVRVLPGD